MKNITKKGFGGLLAALLLAAELAVLADLAASWLGHPLPGLPWRIGAGVLFLVLALLPVSRRGLWDEAVSLLLLCIVAAFLARGYLLFASRSEGYSQADRGKGALYAGHRVLVAAPRPGDEIGLAGGITESYLRYGSEVYWLFTGGEEDGEAARASAAILGIPAERVMFLDEETPAAIQAVLGQIRPDVVLGAAQGKSGDSPLLKAALGRMREQEPSYDPLVLLGLLDCSPADFYSANILSTQEASAADMRTAGGWDTRLRLPVDPAVLSRSLLGSSLYAQLRLYGEEFQSRAESLINGDRVFWQLGDSPAETGLDFVKVMDEEGNFVYDYYIDQRGKASFRLYTGGAADQPYSVSVEGDRCSAKIGQSRTLEVSCPKGRQCIVTVTSGDGKYWDTVVISNPGRYYRSTAQSVEQLLRHVREAVIPETNSWQLWQDLWHRLRA